MGCAIENDRRITKCRSGSSGLLHLETDEEAAHALVRARRLRNRVHAERRDTFWTACAVLALGAAAIVGLGSAIADHAAGAARRSTPLVKMTVAVAPGDTLWALANRYGSPDGNVDEEVEDMADANGITSATALTPGQRLTITVTNPRMLSAIHPVRLMAIASAR